MENPRARKIKFLKKHKLPLEIMILIMNKALEEKNMKQLWKLHIRQHRIVIQN